MTDKLVTLITDTSDIETAFKIISEGLYVTGYPELEKYSHYKNYDSLLVHLVNIVWTLVKHRKGYVSNKLNSEQLRIDLEYKIKMLQKKVSTIEDKYKTAQNEINKKIQACEIMKAEKAQALQELTNSKVAFQKAQKLLQSRNEEYCNKIRQKEFEIIELQKTLEKKIDLKRILRNQSSNSTAVNRDVAQIEKINENHLRQIENLYKTTICRLEDTVTTLIQENINLRSAIELLTRQLLKLYHTVNVNNVNKLKANLQNANGNNQPKDDHGNTISEHLFNVPGNNIIQLVEQNICGIINKITDRLLTHYDSK